MSLSIDIWSDITCPWCYIGKHRLERALDEFEHPVAIRWHAFELDVAAPRIRDRTQPYEARLAVKYGVTVREAAELIRRMTEVAALEGIELRFDRIQPGNTFDAHRLLAFAREHGSQSELAERFMRAYLTEGVPIGDREALARLAVEVGLADREVRDVLETDRFGAEVRADELQARELDVTGVPFFVLDRRFGISGAQSSDLLLVALERSWLEQPAHAGAGAAYASDLCS